MTKTFRCPVCHSQFRIDERKQGQKVKCPNAQCHSTVLIPNAGVATRPVPVKAGHVNPSAREHSNTSPDVLPTSYRGTVASTLSKPKFVVGGAVLLLLCITAVGGVSAFMTSGAIDPFSDLVSKAVPKDQPPTEAEKEATRAREQAEKVRRGQEERQRQEKMAAAEAAKKKDNEERIAAEKMAAEKQAERLRQDAMEAQAKAAKEADSAVESPFSIIKADPHWRDTHEQWLFELPSPGDESSSQPLPLRTQGNEVELSLCKAAKPLFGACPIQLELLRTSDDPGRWLVVASQTGTQVELGEYTLETVVSAEPNAATPDHLLNFSWRRDAAREMSAAELLRWWPLQISVGDRSVVLLQRPAYVSEVPLKWESFVNSQKIVFPRSLEIQAIEMVPNSRMSFCLEIQQVDSPPQTLCLDLGNSDVENKEREPVEAAAVCSANFPLTVPLKSQETVPDVLESPLGFGSLQLRVTRTPEDGLVVQPKLELVLRLPGKVHLETFPSADVFQAFTAVSKDPEQIRVLPSSNGIRKVAEQVAEQTRDNHEFWHRQPLRAMAPKSSFEPEFMDRAKASVKFVKQIVRKAEGEVTAARNAVAEQERQMAVLIKGSNGGGGAARMLATFDQGLAQLRQRLSQAEIRLGVARQLAPDIDRYCADLSELTVDFTEQHESLMQDYDAINVQVKELLNASKTGYFKLHGEMTATIQTPQAENGPSIRISFVKASSQVP